MTIQVSIVVGNPKPKSRTLQVAEALVSKLLAQSEYELHVVDLVDYVGEVLVWPSDKMDALTEQVAKSDIAIFASPTYKATYSGLLKSFLDRYPADGLSGLMAIPLHTGADPTHSMGPTVNLAPLLMELGAVVPGSGFYFVISNMDRLDEITREAADRYAATLQRLASIGLRVAGAQPSELNI